MQRCAGYLRSAPRVRGPLSPPASNPAPRASRTSAVGLRDGPADEPPEGTQRLGHGPGGCLLVVEIVDSPVVQEALERRRQLSVEVGGARRDEALVASG